MVTMVVRRVPKEIRLSRSPRLMSSRMNKVEQKVEQVEAKQDKMEDKQELNVVKQDKVNNEFEERLRKLEQNSGSGVIKEVDDRMEKLGGVKSTEVSISRLFRK